MILILNLLKLYNEFSVALKMNYEDTKKYVVDSVEKGYKDE